jgi:hypothetical protein
MKRTVTREEWIREGERRFGYDMLNWKFVCPVCGYIASGQEWLDAGAPIGAIGYECISRYSKTDKGPCNHAGGELNPVEIKASKGSVCYFEFVTPSQGIEWLMRFGL